MPATPRFSVSQTHDAVVVCIKVPHVRVGNAETHVDGLEFSFFCKPYLLRCVAHVSVRGGALKEDRVCHSCYILALVPATSAFYYYYSYSSRRYSREIDGPYHTVAAHASVPTAVVLH